VNKTSCCVTRPMTKLINSTIYSPDQQYEKCGSRFFTWLNQLYTWQVPPIIRKRKTFRFSHATANM